MMGALGNGRRGGRSPSLLVAALITCVLLLGFNYWVSNSRNVELQSKILELEERVRQLTADRDREQQNKLKVEDEMHRQLELKEENHLRKQEKALNSWKQEKDDLKLNISSSYKIIQELKNHMKSLLDNLNKIQSEQKSCESNLEELGKKANSDMSQCKKQIEAVKEECNGKISADKLEKQNTTEKVTLQVQNVPKESSKQKVSVPKVVSEAPASNHSRTNMTKPLNGKPDVKPPSKKVGEIKTNELVVKKDAPVSKLTNKNETLNRPAIKDIPDPVVDVKEQAYKDTDTLLDEAGILEPKDEDIRIDDINEDDDKIGEGKEEDTAIGQEDAIMYDNEGEIEKQLSKIKDENQVPGQDLEDEMANYNGDEDNQPESEDDKQAQLAGM